MLLAAGGGGAGVEDEFPMIVILILYYIAVLLIARLAVDSMTCKRVVSCQTDWLEIVGEEEQRRSARYHTKEKEYFKRVKALYFVY